MIWLIGRKGMLGSELCTLFDLLDIYYIGTDIEVNITNMDILEEFVKKQSISWIINCSAYTAVDEAEDEIEKAFQINAYGVENLAKIAKKLNVPIVHISSDYVFSGNENKELVEEDETSPVSVYGKRNCMVIWKIWK